MHNHLLIGSLFALLPALTLSQAPSFDNPGCTTAYSLASSCADKYGAESWPAAPNTVVFSCLCFDGSNSYVPTAWDNPASECTSYLSTAYAVPGNPFFTYAAGLCTDPSYWGTFTTGTESSTTTTGGTRNPTPGSTVNPEGPIVTVSSSSSSSNSSPGSTNSGGPTITSSPSSSSTGTLVAAKSSSSVSAKSSSSSAAGAKLTLGAGLIWSVIGALLAAILAF